MRVAILLVAWLMLTSVCDAATYYVRTDGNNSNAGTTNSSGGAWLTITFASDNVAAGDTIRVQAGTYTETPTPSDNGTDGNVITYVADGVVNVWGMVCAACSYQRWIGFTFDGDLGGSILARTVNITGTSHHMEFWNNTVKDGGSGFDASSNLFTARLNSSVFVGNVITNLNVGGSDTGTAAVVYGSYNFYSHNEISVVECDGFGTYGVGLWYLNNYSHDMVDLPDCHSDYFQYGSLDTGLSQMTWEANLQIGLGGGDEHTSVLQDYQPERCTGGLPANCGLVTQNVFRRNVIHDIGSGTWGFSPGTNHEITYNYIYHNDEITTQRSNNSSGNAGAFIYNGTNNTYARNNLAYDDWSPLSTTLDVFYIEGTKDFDYNFAYDSTGMKSFSSSWNAQTNEVTQQDPDFVDFADDDFTLQASSPAIAAAGRLTTTSGSGTGSTFSTVAGGGGWFRAPDATNLPQYSGNLTKGDVVTVGTDTCTIVSIATDAITCAETFTWANAENVFYGTDTTPDMGSYPYKAGGYSLGSPTWDDSGGTVTVTVADATLVRFVVCYNNTVPYAVDNSSPYTCAAASGTPTYRVYPMFASATLWVDAQEDDPPADPIPVSIRRLF